MDEPGRSGSRSSAADDDGEDADIAVQFDMALPSETTHLLASGVDEPLRDDLDPLKLTRANRTGILAGIWTATFLASINSMSSTSSCGKPADSQPLRSYFGRDACVQTSHGQAEETLILLFTQFSPLYHPNTTQQTKRRGSAPPVRPPPLAARHGANGGDAARPARDGDLHTALREAVERSWEARGEPACGVLALFGHSGLRSRDEHAGAHSRSFRELGRVRGARL